MRSRTDTGTLTAHVPTVLLNHLQQAPDEKVRSLEATVVFVDISGFTKLSERLARTGQEGAEQLTDTISACFSTLLAQAYAEGGVAAEVRRRRAALVVHGRGARARGLHRSAVAMRSTLRADRPRPRRREHDRAADVGRRSQRRVRHVPGRRIAPRVHRGRAGREHGRRAREPRRRRADPAQRADRRRLPERCRGARSDPASCSRVPRHRVPWLSRDAAAGAATSCRPMPVDRAAGAPARGAGASRASHGDRRVRAVRRARRARSPRRVPTSRPRRSRRSCARPRRRPTATRSACSAPTSPPTAASCSSAPARRARSATTRSGCCGRCATSSRPARELPVRVGVNRGHVFAGEVGPPYRRTYTVMGDVVNLAARLCAKAPWRAIYATEPACSTAPQTRFEPPPWRRSWSRGRRVRSRRSRSACAAAPPPPRRPSGCR